jgi:alpha-galactosidase
MDRRKFLWLTSSVAVSSTLFPSSASAASTFADALSNSPGGIVPVDPNSPDAQDVHLTRRWNGDFCESSLANHGKHPVRVKQVSLFSVKHNLPVDTGLYGESFQMLSQTTGTLGAPEQLGLTDLKHYKIPQPEGVLAFSGLMTLAPPGAAGKLLAFTSCEKFIGRFFVTANSVEVVVDTEGLPLDPGESWQLEEFMFTEGPQVSESLARLAARVNQHHPHRTFLPIPTGWCSWYGLGAHPSAEKVLENIAVMAKKIPELKYVQIDDGYQPAYGDWLEKGGPGFGGDVAALLKKAREMGFEPGIWVAPFAAESKAQVLHDHPDWFVQDENGKPLASDKVTFGGWHDPPWYALDGTHPEVQKHFENIFSVMRRDWCCTYFKLDGIFWGAMHGGRFHDPKATRIEAYRRGMEAIRRGVGDAFILGCNHPIWPSFGLIDGSRSSNDISGKWDRFKADARQGLLRNWQNGRLWWNDPDAVLLTGDLTGNEFQFHATAIFASGGMVLSGDDMTKISPERIAMLKKLSPPSGEAAVFTDSALRTGTIRLPNQTVLCGFNWEDAPTTLSFRLPKPMRITDFWSGEDLGKQEGTFTLKDVPAHSARLLVCV